MNTEKLYMNLETGSVDTLDGWFPHTPEKDGLVEVARDENGDWQSV